MGKWEKLQRERITGMVKEATDLLGITNEYELQLIFDTGIDGDTETDHKIYPTAACTTAQWQYKRAKIRWFIPICASLSDERLFAIVIHELVHVLLNPLDSLMPDEDDKGWCADRNEYTTEIVTRAILAASGRPLVGAAE